MSTVYVCVCVSVCLSARISPEPHARSLPLLWGDDSRSKSKILGQNVCPTSLKHPMVAPKRLCIPHRTPWRYTNVVLLLLLLILMLILILMLLSEFDATND